MVGAVGVVGVVGDAEVGGSVAAPLEVVLSLLEVGGAVGGDVGGIGGVISLIGGFPILTLSPSEPVILPSSFGSASTTT